MQGKTLVAASSTCGRNPETKQGSNQVTQNEIPATSDLVPAFLGARKGSPVSNVSLSNMRESLDATEKIQKERLGLAAVTRWSFGLQGFRTLAESFGISRCRVTHPL